MPTLYILGGANGCGKTTWYNTQIQKGEIDSTIPFINIDNIVLQELGTYSAENISLAESIARERMTIHIEQNCDFMIESNLSKSADYEWINKMRAVGYETVLYFLGTDDFTINMDRVLNRVAEGATMLPRPLLNNDIMLALLI
ncbi:MAG: zeta toxin family protein [Sediminibacterium sp.]